MWRKAESLIDHLPRVAEFCGMSQDFVTPGFFVRWGDFGISRATPLVKMGTIALLLEAVQSAVGTIVAIASLKRLQAHTQTLQMSDAYHGL